MNEIIKMGLVEINELKQRLENESDEFEKERIENLIRTKSAEISIIIAMESIRKKPEILEGWHLPGWVPDKD